MLLLVACNSLNGVISSPQNLIWYKENKANENFATKPLSIRS